MLRKVSGIEREITLPCGEQVMPFHEHGVELVGFHEERTECLGDDLGAPDTRESKACPSEERQVITSIFVRVRQKKKNKENNKVVTVFPIWIVKKVKMAWSWRLMMGCCLRRWW